MKKLGILGTSLALFATIGALSFSNASGVAKAESNSDLSTTEVTNYSTFHEEAVEIDPKELSVSITQSNRTDNSQNYKFNFFAGFITYKAGRQYNISYAITDVDFDPNNLPTKPEDDPETEENEEELYIPPVFEGAVYSINTFSSGDKIVIPDIVNFPGGHFQIKITSINEDVFSENVIKRMDKIANIYLPTSLTSVTTGAFRGIGEQTKVHVPVLEQDCVFGEHWTEYLNNVEYGYVYDEDMIKFKTNNSNISQNKPEANETSYTIGYVDEQNPANSKPLIVAFDVIKADGSVVPTQIELPVDSSNNYEVVGNLGAKDYSKSVTIMLDIGDTINDETVTLYNIYKAVQISLPEGKGNTIIPDTTTEYKTTPRLAYSNILYANDFFDVEFLNLGSFIDYTSITINLNCKKDVYIQNKPAAYESQKDNIEKGSTYLRYRLTNLDSTYFNLTYIGNDGNTYAERVKFDVKNSSAIVGGIGKNNFTFLFNNNQFSHGINAENIRGISFDDLTITIDLFTETGKASNGSTLSATFGSLLVVDPNVNKGSLNTYDLNFVCILSLIIFVVAYVLGTIALFFFNKERYKNDEFKRVVPARFFKRAAIIGVGLMVIIFALLFIISRFGIIANNTVVFNPIDIPIIIFAVLAILFIGYFVKEMVVAYKNYKQNKERIRLNLDADKVDDGTN